MFLLFKSDCIWVIAILFNCFSRSLWFKTCRIRTALMLSILLKTTSCSIVAVSRMLPFVLELASHHCFAVIPNRATFSISASSAYTKLILSFDSVGGIRFRLPTSPFSDTKFLSKPRNRYHIRLYRNKREAHNLVLTECCSNIVWLVSVASL